MEQFNQHRQVSCNVDKLLVYITTFDFDELLNRVEKTEINLH